jgi:hypothetical protein
LYTSHAASVHVMRSVEMGQEPPVPVSWMMRPSSVTLCMRLVLAPAGSTSARLSRML